jgi:hypothetical protein
MGICSNWKGCSFGYDGRVVLAKMQRQQDAKTLGNSGAKTDGNIDDND